MGAAAHRPRRRCRRCTTGDWPISSIDHFVLAKLEAAQLSAGAGGRPAGADPPRDVRLDRPAADAGRSRSLCHGRFAADAYERLVDRLLASPHYGERWGRHWLDVVRFAESQGFERNKFYPSAWKYRDWVIQAFNDDLPYDEFVRLQLAGDVLHPDDPAALVAAGYLVVTPHDLLGLTQGSAAMKANTREDELENLVGNIGQTFLGMTINCARCHDHKFDPLRAVRVFSIGGGRGRSGAQRASGCRTAGADAVARPQDESHGGCGLQAIEDHLAALLGADGRAADRQARAAAMQGGREGRRGGAHGTGRSREERTEPKRNNLQVTVADRQRDLHSAEDMLAYTPGNPHATAGLDKLFERVPHDRRAAIQSRA